MSLKQHLSECKKCKRTFDIRTSREENKCSSCIAKADKKQSDLKAIRGTRTDNSLDMGSSYVKFYEGIA